MISGGLFDLDNKLKRKDELDNIINSSSFWNSSDRELILKENNSLNDIINRVMFVKNKIDSNLLILEEKIDSEMFSLIDSEYEEIKVLVDKLRIDTYLSGEFDKNDCILEIHSGAGGTESCDWAMMLYRMYTRYLSKNGYKYEEVDKQPGEEVGIKSILINISGNNAYGYLKGERGVHRLVRISPFDSGKRRHTSFASVEVTPKFDNSINIEINESDIRVDIYRSSGPGGQGVNTTDSAVRITHLPTGIVVTCQNERSQIRNRETAMEILKSKLYSIEVMKKNSQINDLKGDQMTIGFGSAKRSYVMCPYTLVKDNESGYESSSVDKILDGDIGELLEKNIRR
ncbi:MAG: peptide chain release factor 2 [Bacilli bacterium]|nr:peptide chain release factor 2 [Bacilli bacterium]